MKFRVLRYFVVLAEELHFGRAAQRLAITQPPLSTAIKSLEEELGVLLFQRTKTSVALTPAGTVFLAEARKLLEGADRARVIVKSVDQGMTGRLDIGFNGTLLFRDILRVVERFRNECPGIEVVLREMQSADQFEWLQHGRLDAGFCHGASTVPKLRSVPLKEDRLVLCVPATHPKAGYGIISLSELADEPFLMFEREINPVNHDTLISMFSRAGIYPKIVHYTRNWMTTMAMVSEGWGMAIVPTTLGRMQMKGVRLIPLSGHSEVAHGMLAWNPALITPALEKFLESAGRTIRPLDDRDPVYQD